MRPFSHILLAVLMFCSVTGYSENLALDALERLRLLKTEQTRPQESAGWINSSTINLVASTKPNIIYPITDASTADFIAKLKQGKEIFLSAQFLGNSDVIQALVFAKRTNAAFVVCLLENKINAPKYVTPDFLTQNGIYVFYPGSKSNITGSYAVIDDTVYFLSTLTLDDKQAGYLIKLTDSRSVVEAKSHFLNILNTSEMSDFTKLRHPGAMRAINSHLEEAK